MTITYELGNSLYVNVTNRCSNNCIFCVRNKHNGVNGKDSLFLDREPEISEIKDDFNQRDLSKYDSVVFCGYGEPLMRFKDCMEISKWLKENNPSLHIRINTNGQANLIENRDVTPEFNGLIDSLSISLNAPDKESYNKICQSIFGELAFDALKDFATCAKKYISSVTFTVVDKTVSDSDIEQCRQIAEECGVNFRIRSYIE